MSKDEHTNNYMLWVTEEVNGIKVIGGKLDEYEVAKKVLRSPPKSYRSKVSAIEERNDLDKYTMDQLYGAFITFEMREFELDAPKMEVVFKSS